MIGKLLWLASFNFIFSNVWCKGRTYISVIVILIFVYKKERNSICTENYNFYINAMNKSQLDILLNLKTLPFSGFREETVERKATDELKRYKQIRALLHGRAEIKVAQPYWCHRCYHHLLLVIPTTYHTSSNTSFNCSQQMVGHASFNTTQLLFRGLGLIWYCCLIIVR